jgi:hypothetical protein
LDEGLDALTREHFDLPNGELTDRITAAVIVNNAVLKCLLSGLPPTGDNITLMVGDFFDPNDEKHEGLVSALLLAIEEMSALGAKSYTS